MGAINLRYLLSPANLPNQPHLGTFGALAPVKSKSLGSIELGALNMSSGNSSTISHTTSSIIGGGVLIICVVSSLITRARVSSKEFIDVGVIYPLVLIIPLPYASYILFPAFSEIPLTSSGSRSKSYIASHAFLTLSLGSIVTGILASSISLNLNVLSLKEFNIVPTLSLAISTIPDMNILYFTVAFWAFFNASSVRPTFAPYLDL